MRAKCFAKRTSFFVTRVAIYRKRRKGLFIIHSRFSHSIIINNNCHMYRMKIKKLPNVLALHLKRFKYQEDVGRYIKLAYRVAFPFELRLFNTVDDMDDADRLYNLFAIVVHIGKCVISSFSSNDSTECLLQWTPSWTLHRYNKNRRNLACL